MMNRASLSKRWHMATVLYVSFVLIILLPIFIVTWFSVRSFNTVLFDNVTTRAMQTLEQVSYNVDKETSRIINTVATIANDEKVFATATSIHTQAVRDQQASHEASNDLDHQLSNYFHSTSDIVSALFFYRDEGTYAYKQGLGLQEAELRHANWYQQTLANVNKVQIFGAEDNRLPGTSGHMEITASIAPKFPTSFNMVESVYFVFRGSVLQQLLRTQVSEPGYFLVVAQNGAVVTGSDDEMIQNNLSRNTLLQQAMNQPTGNYVANEKGKQSFVIFMTSVQTGWKYIHVMPYDQMLSQVRHVYNRTMLVSTLGLLVFLIASWIWVRSMAKPILTLVKQMNRVKMGNFQVQIEASGPTEIYVLGNSFNEMTLRIQELIQEREKKEAERLNAEMTALQSQIGPHFLVNTLNAIKIMALMVKAPQIQKMTEALMHLVSSAFNRGGIYTTVGEELLLLNDYFTIMRIRYGDRFEIQTDLDEEIKGLYMLRLLLQPLVENSIVHGFHGLDRKGVIQIQGHKVGERHIQIIIKDNGKGFEEDSDLTRKKQRQETFNGIGLQNVQQRIDLQYGREFGLRVKSQPGEGTYIELLLPLLVSKPVSQVAIIEKEG
ncbi:two-component system sensor histidine kinase YesM [Paenibacillus sp. V4I3]|uniref:sensor histidine kinase n=1 Tax=unclassified Paenibacillus TaxID=185978 RepID=UPI0027832FC6|nr:MULTISPECIES: histidine kinase [unclassified Paenibacillus]MDQ0877121.1 two-component system sensor histidine kinase YesM [Paenibacillus sp. V4I3]MDQ0886998.1 two-component system sensor histidine kinase YesM [Paenibacillus sp. V4I9]